MALCCNGPHAPRTVRVREPEGVVTMTAINVDGNTYYLQAGADPSTKCVVMYGDDGARVVLGTVERVEYGAGVRWRGSVEGYGRLPGGMYRTRRECVGDVVSVWTDRVDVEPVDAVEAPEGVRVVESRAGDYVEVSVDGEHHVYTWAEDRGVVRDYLVTVDGHADYGDFNADPVGWVRAYYAHMDTEPTDAATVPDTCGTGDAEGVTCDECGAVSVSGWGDLSTCVGCAPESNVCRVHVRTHDGVCPLCDAETEGVPEPSGAPLGEVARRVLDTLSGETDVRYTPTESGTGDVSAVVWATGDGGNRNTYRVGVFMSDAGTVFNGMDGAGDHEHMVTDDADAAVGFIRNHLGVTAPECVVCGEPVDYCQGHGSDNYAAFVWAAHDADYHGACRASCRTEGARGVLIVSREYDPDTDVHDGDVDYADTWAEWHPGASLMDAVDILTTEHLTTDADAHGPDVWTEGDARGERVDYRTGTVTETEGYLYGYTDGERAVIAALATGDTWTCGDIRVTGRGHRVWTEYADDDTEIIPLTVGDPLPVGDLLITRKAFSPAIVESDPDRVTGLMDGACATSAFDGYGALHDHADGTWSVVHMSW